MDWSYRGGTMVGWYRGACPEAAIHG